MYMRRSAGIFLKEVYSFRKTSNKEFPTLHWCSCIQFDAQNCTAYYRINARQKHPMEIRMWSWCIWLEHYCLRNNACPMPFPTVQFITHQKKKKKSHNFYRIFLINFIEKIISIKIPSINNWKKVLSNVWVNGLLLHLSLSVFFVWTSE